MFVELPELPADFTFERSPRRDLNEIELMEFEYTPNEPLGILEDEYYAEPEINDSFESTQHPIAPDSHTEGLTVDSAGQSRKIVPENHSEQQQSHNSLMESQSSQEKSKDSPASSDKRKNRSHLERPRRKKGQKDPIEKQFDGYFTKNFLPIAKNPHFEWIAKEKGEEFINSHPVLLEIRTKNGITKGDYLYIYSVGQLIDVWKEFFRKRVLYRAIPLSRAQNRTKKMFFKYINRYREAFETGIFERIADLA